MPKDMKKILIISGVILLGFIILAVSAANNTKEQIKENEDKVSEFKEELEAADYIADDDMIDVGYSEGYDKETLLKEFEGDFVLGCTEEGGTYTECRCMYDSLINQLGFDGVVNMSMNYLNTGQMPTKVLVQAMEDCY